MRGQLTQATAAVAQSYAMLAVIEKILARNKEKQAHLPKETEKKSAA